MKKAVLEEPIPSCLDLCEHCVYIECGDYICDINNDVTIVDWKPFPCVCPDLYRPRRNES